MKSRITLGICLALVTIVLSAQTQSPTDVVRKIVEVEKQLPWFWTPYPEGIRDVPYLYEYQTEKRKLDSKGHEVLPPKLKDGHYKQSRSFHMEHIPLDGSWGWETRCIEMDHLPCGPGPFDVPPQKDPGKLSEARAHRREVRVALWDEFLNAFHFELVEANHVYFKPTGVYKHKGPDDAAIFERIEGDFWFDTSTHEITRMEYELTSDVGNLIAKLYKGTRFTAELTKSIDNHYLPAKLSLRMNQRMLTSKGAEESETRYFNYRKFGSSVTLTFGDVQ